MPGSCSTNCAEECSLFPHLYPVLRRSAARFPFEGAAHGSFIGESAHERDFFQRVFRICQQQFSAVIDLLPDQHPHRRFVFVFFAGQKKGGPVPAMGKVSLSGKGSAEISSVRLLYQRRTGRFCRTACRIYPNLRSAVQRKPLSVFPSGTGDDQ